MELDENKSLILAEKFVEETHQHIFLTGKAGTGKTTFLKRLRDLSHKRMIVTAPTGVAAINANGVTLHSFFQLSFGPQISGYKTEPIEAQRFSKEKINIIKSLDLLVIDEISMVRADLLDAIDKVLRRFRNKKEPFGGIQLLMIGDLQQLSPVVKDDERNLLYSYYQTPYFFSSKALQETSFISIELTHVYRQQDNDFIELLNQVRDNKVDEKSIQMLNRRHIENFLPKEDGYITLCTHNFQAQQINDKELELLPTKAELFTAKIEGKFPEYSFPTEYQLALKEKAQVMFVKNDTSQEKRFYNGKIGIVTRIFDDIIYVKCENEDEEIEVTPMKWENIKYTIDDETNTIKESIEGSFTQYPLRLAWAITVHKSQGLTFEKVIINAEAAFAHGQVYVALSRCKTLDGIVLSKPLTVQNIINDATVNNFIYQIEKNRPTDLQLNQSIIAYQHEILADTFSFDEIQKELYFLVRFSAENVSAIPQYTIDNLIKIRDQFSTKISKVSVAFNGQIARLLKSENNVVKNSSLLERIQKAAIYFSDKLQTCVTDPIEQTDTDIDNKTVKSTLTDHIEKLQHAVTVKNACLGVCKTKFSVAEIVEKRSIARMEKLIYSRKKTKTINLKHVELVSRLLAWRGEIAEKLNVTAFQIFPQKSLADIISLLPVRKKTLLKVHGFGKKKVDAFGDEICEIILQYCKEKNIATDEIQNEVAVSKKGDTVQVTAKMLKDGKTIDEIAKERNLSRSTIETHIATLIAYGEVSVTDYLSEEKLTVITNYVKEHQTKSLTTILKGIGSDFSFFDIRLALASME